MKAPRFKSPRLLPIVIFAACALLLFKAVGLVTDGGYVLTGTEAAAASDAATAPAAGGDAASGPTMADSSPTLSDTAPTLANLELPEPDAAGKAGAVSSGNAAPAGGEKEPAGSPAADDPMAATAAPLPPCPPGSPPPSGTAGPATCMPADAVPMKADATGTAVPMVAADGAAPTLLQRLADRRAELDKREQRLNMREAVIAAAEKQMTQRADELKALQEQIAALTVQKKSMEDEQFSGIVKMYEAMKPQEAAAIFDGLDMNVLLRVAKAMDPRKMSPILAKMASTRAQQLTVQIAAGDPQTVASVAPVADPNALPQIVGR